MSELKDCPLQFHDFKSVDHVKVCPRYTAVLARSEDDGIGIEELDTLQLELETLLSSASRRLRVLEAETQVRHRSCAVAPHTEASHRTPVRRRGCLQPGTAQLWLQDPTDTALFQILTDWQDKKGDRRFLKLSKDHDVSTSVKHGKPKKQKLEGKGGHGTGPGPGRPKSKNLQPKIQEYEFQDDPIDVPRIPKNDAPNRCVGVWGVLGSPVSLAAPSTKAAASPRELIPWYGGGGVGDSRSCGWNSCAALPRKSSILTSQILGISGAILC